MFGFFRKKYEKNVERDNEFLKEYAGKVNGLILFAEENEKVKTELKALQDDFQYCVASPDPKAKKLEKKIKADFENLSGLLKGDWEEKEIIILIREIRQAIVDLRSIR